MVADSPPGPLVHLFQISGVRSPTCSRGLLSVLRVLSAVMGVAVGVAGSVRGDDSSLVNPRGVRVSTGGDIGRSRVKMLGIRGPG